MKELVDHPEHYQSNSIEAIDVIEGFDLNFNLGNVIKYILQDRCEIPGLNLGTAFVTA